MDRSRRHRFSRQIQFPGIGEPGQERLARAAAAVVGCGGLGSTLVQCLGRAGIRRLTIIDQDEPDFTNLHRQFLFDEKDVAGKTNKARLAGRRIARADSGLEVKAIAQKLAAKNADALLSGHDLVLDGLDNMPGRFLVNDWCVKNRVPWIYGGVAGATGMVLVVRPGHGPCLRCLFPDPEAAAQGADVKSAGIINTLPAHVATLQATEAVKLLVRSPALVTDLRIVDLWRGADQKIKLRRDPDCPCCGKHRFEFLESKKKE